MSDFESVLRQYVTEQSAIADARYGLDPAGEAKVIAWRIRRRRAARVGSAAAAAAAVVLIAGAGVFAATRPTPVPPAETTSPSVTPTPSESPTAQAPDPEPQGRPAVADHPLLPDAGPLEPGMLAAAPAGSTLVEYVATCGYPCLTPTSPEVLYLVTPDGAIHEVAIDVDDLQLVDWYPGTSVALFSRYGQTGDTYGGEWIAIDLESGEPVGQRIDVDGEDYSGVAWLGGSDDLLRSRVSQEGERPVTVLERVALSDGSVLASVEAPGDPEVVWAPDRAHFFLRKSSGVAVYETRTLDEVALPVMTGTWSSVSSCSGVDWWDAGSLLVVCGVAGEPDSNGVVMPEGQLRRVGLDGSVDILARYPAYPLATRLWHVDGRTVLALNPWEKQYPELGRPANTRFELLAGDTLTNVVADWGERDVTYLASTGSRVVATVYDPAAGSSLVLIDPTTGAFTPLLSAAEPGWGAFLLAVANGDPS